MVLRVLARASRALAPVLLVLLAAAGARAQAPDPFGPHVRWTHAAGAQDPWIPLEVDFAASGRLVGLARGVGERRIGLFSAVELPADGRATPLADERSPAGSIGAMCVRGAAAAPMLVSLVQVPAPTALLRRTEVTRWDPAGPGGALVPAWTHALPLVGNGGARLGVSADGERIVVVVHDSVQRRVQAQWIDAGGTPLSTHTWSAESLRAISLSADGARLAVSAGVDVRVVDEGGAVLHAETLPAPTHAVALSGDGRVLAVGSGDRLRLLADDGAAFRAAFATPASIGETVVRAALSSDGSTLAVGWWSNTGEAVRFQLWHGAGPPALVWERHQAPRGASLQNYPEAVAVTPDGARAAFGAWGVGDGQPEVLLVDRELAATVLELDLPGSVQALALAPSGRAMVVGAKSVHANVPGSVGDVRLVHTGEGDVQLTAQTTQGGRLAASVRAPGAGRVLFLVGPRRAAPLTFPWASGSLHLDRGARLRIYNRLADPSGRADIDVPLPDSPLWAGRVLAVQAAARVGGALVLSETLVEPLVL